MKKIFILPIVLLSLFFVVEIVAALISHFRLGAAWWGNHHIQYYPWYLWVAVGSAVFPLMNKYFVKNMKIVKTFTHELTHAVVAIMLFRRVHWFKAEEGKGGEIGSSGSGKFHFFEVLAPYCFPIYTFPLMMLRCIVIPDYYPIIDIIIGFSIGLHIICFKEQTGSFQPDIQRYPLWLSFSFIAFMLIFDISLVLTSYLPSVNFFGAFVQFGTDFWKYICAIFKAI